jgi:hypothetical protein
LSLPWLEAMTPAKGAPPNPVRMAVLYMPNGVHPESWTPKGTGRDFELSPTLQPLSPFREEILVLTNLWNQASRGGDGHYVKIAGFLNCTTISKTLGVDINANGVSMDQVAAQAAGGQTPLPSLELCTAPVTTGVDRNVGYTRVYGSHIAWSSPTTPLAREINPRLAFERILRATRPGSGTNREDALLLDSVLEEARGLRRELGTADQARLDEYLSVVRSLESRLQKASRPEGRQWKARAAVDEAQKPEGIPKDYAEHVSLMLDMIVLAFQSDVTRVATFLFQNEVSNQNFSFVDGVKEGHHSVSHHQKDPDKLRQYQLINVWHVQQYARLLEKLSRIREAGEPLLDNAMVLLGSGIRDGDRHDPHNLPLVLAGKGGGRLATGQHLEFAPDSPLANLYVSMLDAFGAPVPRFADSTGPLPGVLG